MKELINAVLDALTAATLAGLNWVLDLMTATVFASPDVTVLPQVRYVAGNAQTTANACMGLVMMLAGIIAMSHGSVQDRYSLKELLPRLVIGFVAANTATPIVSGVITGANALTGALAGDRFTSAGSFFQLKRVIVDVAFDPALWVVALVSREIALLLLIGLVATWLGRLAVLLVVAALAPVALACHALPQTEPVARIWWRALLGCLAVQVLQAVTLHLAVATLLAPGANLPDLGLPHDPTGLFNLLIAAFVLWLVVRIPTWAARTFGAGGGRAGSVVASVIRVVVVQQALRAVGLRGGLGRRGAAGGPRTPPTHLHSHQHANAHLHQHLHVHPPRPGGSPAGARNAGAYQAGDASARGRPHPGRPRAAVDGRPVAGPTPPRRAIGPGTS
jgi:hypothetical protein